MMEKTDQVAIQKSIEASLKVLETVGDVTIVNEAKKIEANVNKMVQINRPMVEAYAAELKAFDQSLVAKYGIVEKAAVAEKALPKCAIVCVTGEEMKTKLSGFLDILAGFDASSVGGSVPGDDFYYLGE